MPSVQSKASGTDLFKRADKRGVPLMSIEAQEAIVEEAEKAGNFSATAKKYKMRVENLYRWRNARDKRKAKGASGTDAAAVRPTSPTGSRITQGEVERLREEIDILRAALTTAIIEKERLLRNR